MAAPISSTLPIQSVLGDITGALSSANRLILAAPPGAGKTTGVPLHLLDLIEGRILVLEPRRIAARGAAQRMAELLGERLGERVGLSTRLERKVSSRTRIEVITDGLFTRRILADPELSGIGAVLFDEIHERSLNADLGLALALDAQAALRPDLKLITMSATLDTERFARCLEAPIVESQGRAFPVETRYAGRPPDRLDTHMASVIATALRETEGSILAFLPGARDIRRTQEALLDRGLDAQMDILPLYGALPPSEQDAAIRPATKGRRKVVLSTDIAESAITIEGVTTVVDAGLVRVPAFDPSGRRTRLVTERAALASVDQRRGRAGRTAPGVCYRLWDAPETRGLTREITPEILRADLSGLVLSLAEWGEDDATRLTWLDAPPAGRIAAAQTRLRTVGALSEDGRLTPLGREISALPLPPDQAALICRAETPGEKALGARIAALLSERGLGGNATDLATRLARFDNDRGQRATTLRRQAERWSGGGRPSGDPALLLARIWPDAIARRREAQAGTYLTAGGDAVTLPEHDPLARHDWLVVAEALGGARGARITLAAPLSEADALAASPAEPHETAQFDPVTQKFSARRERRIGAILLSSQPLPKPSGEAARSALLSTLLENGFSALGAEETVAVLLARLDFARNHGADLPDWTAAGLAETADDWLLAEGSAQIPKPGDVRAALLAHLGWTESQELASLAPETLSLPSGRAASVDYLDEKAPLISARVQEVFGLSMHPAIARGAAPVTLSLTSPAQRQVALTKDLPGFWSGGYLDMAKDMRARYPKHDWPADPASARPHEGRTKARLGKD
ncbi:MAG: ATP-dependent helicase HrpB [Hyphomonadaceae bacterium]|nr:ATP-dependent helicase HrpB [Hyphomonadaceae bacterium]